ncbi:MAG: WecB/TagA/CpsF family glycosyltransferase [Clostridia bacterium]|nr:WecB/TagA/CpsF family glycosyltransferase [Clostridia bacterium]
MEKVNVLGVQIDSVTIESATDRICEMLKGREKNAVFTPNSEIIYMAYKDTDFCDMLNSAQMLTADGIGVVYASKILGCPVPERAGGYDIACRVIERISESGERLYLFGGRKGIAETAAENLTKKYPFLNIVGTRDGYFSPEENDAIVADINNSGADLLFVCLGAPTQEKWIYNNREKLNCKVMMGIGGSLDVFAGAAERAPEKWQKLGLEWLYRLIKEPKRFWRMLALPKFAFTVLIKGFKYPQEGEEDV